MTPKILQYHVCGPLGMFAFQFAGTDEKQIRRMLEDASARWTHADDKYVVKHECEIPLPEPDKDE